MVFSILEMVKFGEKDIFTTPSCQYLTERKYYTLFRHFWQKVTILRAENKRYNSDYESIAFAQVRPLSFVEAVKKLKLDLLITKEVWG